MDCFLLVIFTVAGFDFFFSFSCNFEGVRRMATSTITIWHYINRAVNVGLTVSEKSVFPTSFGRGRFQRNLFSFEKHKWLQKILFDVICLEIRHNGVTFLLTVVDENQMN